MEPIKKRSAAYNPGNRPLKFLLTFIVLFPAFYYFNLFYLGITSPGNHYSAFLADHLDYISGLRWLLLKSSAQILNWLGFTAITNRYDLLTAGHGVLQLAYSCLGLGLISFFSAFVLAYPVNFRSKMTFLATGILGIEILNVARFVLLSLFWNRSNRRILDHHTIFNIILYIVIAIALYLWIKRNDISNNANAAN